MITGGGGGGGPKKSTMAFFVFIHDSTCHQVETSFVDMPQIAHFKVEKKSPYIPWEEGTHTLPVRLLSSLGLGLRYLENLIHNRSCRIVEISFLDMLQIAHFQVKK